MDNGRGHCRTTAAIAATAVALALALASTGPVAARGQPAGTAAPPHQPLARRGPLSLVLATSSGAPARAVPGGLVFGRARSALAYRNLVVSDARGRRLRAWLTLAGGRVVLHAATAGARYPVTVD